MILDYKDGSSESLNFTSLNNEIDAVSLFIKQVNEQSSIDIKAKRVDPSDIQDAQTYELRSGSRVTVQKKKIFNVLDVACKPISMNSMRKIQKQLAILGKLDACPYIIKFYGLSEIANENVLVFEWAEYGTLREFYQKCRIGWEEKISIARDICRALVFLHAGVMIFLIKSNFFFSEK